MDARWCAEPTDPVYYVMAVLTIASATVVVYSCVLLAAAWAIGAAVLLPRASRPRPGLT
jgi:hypothetical protein